MRRRAALSFAIVLVLGWPGGSPQAQSAAPAVQQDAPLALETSIPLEGVSGRIDHMAADPRRNRLIIAELGNNTVDVVDLSTRRVIHRIVGLREPQGVGYAEKADLVFVANAGDGSVRMFRGEDLVAVGSIALGDDADNVRVNPRDGSVVVGYGRGGLAVIDPISRVQVADIELPGHPEGFQIDPDTGRAYVNLPDARQIAVVDLAGKRISATWKRTGASANFPMALSVPQGLLATVFRNPARLALLNRGTGAAVASLAACGDADDVFFDERAHRVYVSCGSGNIAVYQQGSGGYSPTASVRTSSGARTSLFVPDLNRLFVAARAGPFGAYATILVYTPVP